ncbi:TMEM43 family protein [Lysobacter sp. N42]|jgi:hypothetical protein|uniref:TMEM43 family protein n=1 Tax=Lysobacter sp. N42 TaxID=2545719 RepID=UPI00104468A4|nr:TMEM43 family protein [Lysobacter sp. N42]TCZ86625.1 hypothetical protein EYQ95_17920 [Lysobacter sp. N42]
MSRLLAPLLLGALLAGPVCAQEGAPQGEPRGDRRLRDPDFGVESDAFGLERRVEMYQWRRDANGYARVWNAAPIDSSDFDPAHRNPPRLPVRNRQWWVGSVTLDGRPLPLATVRLLGQWTPLRPGFSALPEHFARRYQPEGDGLGSSYNPLAPEIGDVRITWHEFTLPPLAGKVELRDGAWRLTPRTAAAPQPARPAVDIAATAHSLAMRLRPWIIALAVAALVGVWFLVRALTGGRS